MNLSAQSAWLNAWAQHNIDDLRMGLSLVTKHPRRGPLKSFDGQTRQVPENAPTLRAAGAELAADDAVDVFLIEGASEVRLTMPLAGLGERTSAMGLIPAMADVIGDPPGWPAPLSAAALLPPLVADDLPPRQPPHRAHPSDDAWTLPSLRPRLALVPRSPELGPPRPRPISPLPKTATSSINCDECATPLDLDFEVWPDGPDWAGGPRRVDVQGLGRPRCPNPDCPSNGGSKPPESGVRLRGDGTDDEDGDDNNG